MSIINNDREDSLDDHKGSIPCIRCNSMDTKIYKSVEQGEPIWLFKCLICRYQQSLLNNDAIEGA